MSEQLNRLANGGSIDRSRPVEFVFNGRRYRGYAGDTLASALLANGLRVVSRSFKYHRPRGLFSAGEEEPNGVLFVSSGRRQLPLSRAPLVPLESGLVAKSQNCFPGVNVDFGRIFDFTRALWPAGFYNKTFKWPSWRWYEGVIRRTAGLGRLAKGLDPCVYQHCNAHCDVLICGAGPAGLSAALAAGRSGAQVMLLEQDTLVGGSLLVDPVDVDGSPGGAWMAAVTAELAAMVNVSVMTSTTVCGYYDHNVLSAIDRSDAWHPDRPVERFWKIRANQVVIAAGSIEQPLIFDDNDRPGIMLSGAVREYLRRYAVAAGRSVAVYTNNDEAYRTAFSLHDAGSAVPAIVDTRAAAGHDVLTGAGNRGIPVVMGAVIAATHGTKGITAVDVAVLSPRRDAVPERRIRCDALAVSGGWSPTVHLYSQAGGKLQYDERLACFIPRNCPQSVRVAGSANAEFDLERSLDSGFETGRAAAVDAGFLQSAGTPPKASCNDPAYGPPGPRISPIGRRSRQWIDLQHDVTAADIELAVRENFVSVEHMKRYTTAGMSIDQGKTGNLNALTCLAELTGKPVSAVGTTTFRPMYMPVPMGAIAGPVHGDLYAPARSIPAYAWHVERRAVFDDYGEWKRPAFYRCGSEGSEASIATEVLAVRQAAGVFDGSPLGKIEVRGPDAAEFLDRLYVNDVLTLKDGCVRYGLMLDENGIILDDGVISRLGENYYLVNSTAANANRVAGWLEEWHQCEWPELGLVIANVTTRWAVATVTGPNARAIVSRLDGDIDFSAGALPHMRVRTGIIEGGEARVQRVSFSGEPSFEISIPADRGEALFRRLVDLGEADGLVPVGIEAILILRMEKGYLHVGSDTDGTTNPLDVGFERVVKNKKRDFVGRRSLDRPHDRRENRRQFVGIEPVDGKTPFMSGAHIVNRLADAMRSEGFVTSAAVSPTLGRPIGLAMVEGGFRRKGEIVTLFDNGALTRARIVDPVFFDLEGKRIHA